jgi:hypothetical protein
LPRLGPPADHELLLVVELELAPRRCPAWPHTYGRSGATGVKRADHVAPPHAPDDG